MIFASRSMKITNIFQAVCATAAIVLGLCGFSARVQSQSKDQPCTTESKQQYYEDFRASLDGPHKDQARALDSAKKYLACPDDSGDQKVLADLNLAIGRILSSQNSPGEAIPYILKAASFDSSVKSSPQTYVDLATAYEEGPYAKLRDAYTVRYQGRDESDESLLALENILQVVDRMIDADARAFALAGIAPSRKEWSGGIVRNGGADIVSSGERLLEFYRFRHNGSTAGIEEFVNTVLSRPLPPEPVPITVLPPKAERLNRQR
jgi:tetratricopeptide (TPR) repeat protein